MHGKSCTARRFFGADSSAVKGVKTWCTPYALSIFGEEMYAACALRRLDGDTGGTQENPNGGEFCQVFFPRRIVLQDPRRRLNKAKPYTTLR